MLVSFERTLFYLTVLVITKITIAVDHYRNQKYRDDGYKANHEQTLYLDTKFKRTPMCRSSSARLLPEVVSGSRHNRPGKGSVAPSGDVERFKEVIHIPCPKRMSNSQGVAPIRFPSSEVGDKRLLRVAKDSRKSQELLPPPKTNQSPSQPTDLNAAVRQNQQWLISSQGGLQQHHNEITPQTNPTQYMHDQNKPPANVHQQFTPDSNYYKGQNWPNYVLPPLERSSDAMKGQQRPLNVNKYDQPNRQQMDNRRIKMKFEGNQANPVPPSNQITSSNGQYSSQHIQKPQEMLPNNGINQMPQTAYDIKTQQALPPSRNEIVLPLQEFHQYPNNAHNSSYDQPINFQSIESPNMILPYPNTSYDITAMYQQGLYPQPVNNTNVGMNYIFKQNNATMPNGPSINYGYNSPREQTVPGSPQNSNRYGSRPVIGQMSVQDATNVNQPHVTNLNMDSGSHLEVIGHPSIENQKIKTGETWKEFNNPSDEFTNDQGGSQTISNQVSNRDKTAPDHGNNLEKPAHGLAAIKGFFGKHKEEMKGRQSAGGEVKPPKSKGHENLLSSSAINVPVGNTDKIGKNERALINGKSGLVVVVEKANGYDSSKSNAPTKNLGNTVMKNDHYYKPMEVIELPRFRGSPASLAALPQQQVVANLNLTDGPTYSEVGTIYQRKQGNVSGPLSHILVPPMTVEPHMFTNEGLKVISKMAPYSEDVTYHPFVGFAPARNDEAFYDKKNLNFLGPIDHPPLVNLKRNKARKPDKYMKPVNKHFKRVSGKYRDEFYSEPADFHSDMAVNDFPQPRTGAKRVRYARKCHQQNPKTFWQHIKGHNKRGFHRSKESSFKSGP